MVYAYMLQHKYWFISCKCKNIIKSCDNLKKTIKNNLKELKIALMILYFSKWFWLIYGKSLLSPKSFTIEIYNVFGWSLFRMVESWHMSMEECILAKQGNTFLLRKLLYDCMYIKYIHFMNFDLHKYTEEKLENYRRF